MDWQRFEAMAAKIEAERKMVLRGAAGWIACYESSEKMKCKKETLR
jgi:hypothetical protein